jgi:hypothetical protein
LTSIFNCGVEDVNLPLMAIIDYRGFRLTCLSVLPINDETLIYGSKDGGKTIFQKNNLFNEKMNTIGKRLNICSHYIKGTIKKPNDEPNEGHIVGPGDIEG